MFVPAIMGALYSRNQNLIDDELFASLLGDALAATVISKKPYSLFIIDTARGTKSVAVSMVDKTKGMIN